MGRMHSHCTMRTTQPPNAATSQRAHAAVIHDQRFPQLMSSAVWWPRSGAAHTADVQDELTQQLLHRHGIATACGRGNWATVRGGGTLLS